ncbi:MAG: lipid A biosynthesis lauroyl acyltransferase [Sulfurimonas sp.]|nr:lipid A biosynthesis lauroyl acyltransferase [Sulfurimonas sp.]
MGYRLLLILEKILMLLPKKLRKSFFSVLATLAYHLSKKYRNIARANIKFLFGNSKSEEEIEEIVRYSFKNLIFNFLHIMELRNMSLDELKSIITVENIEVVKKIHDEGRAVIYITSHYSSWELGGASLGAFVEPVAGVYKKMKNEIYETWLLEGRARFGNTNLEKSRVAKALIKLIRAKKASGILIDTNINPKEGIMIDFFGKPLRQTYTPAYLARKFNAAVIPVTIRTDDEENYTLMLFDEIPVEHTDDESADILKATQLQAKWLEDLIKREPKFWFWLHRRFKNDHPEIYN